MAINFNALPKERPDNLPATGTYIATIISAEMKQPQDTTKNPYLNLCLSLKDKDGKDCGRIYDILSESDKELVQYKLSRFIIALGLEKLGSFELVDLIKVIKNKQLIVDVKQEEAKNGFPAKSVVNLFDGSVYYPISAASEIFGQAVPAPAKTDIVDTFRPVADDSLAINASDAADVHTAEDDDF